MAWTPNYPGKSDLSAFLRVYGGEVVAAYNKATVIKDKLRTRNISSGKSAQFPTISTESAKLHTPGDDLFSGTAGYESDMTNDEKVIQVNRLLIATAFVDGLDEMMQHYNSRSEYATQMGAALGVACDQWSLGALTRGSSASETVTGSYANAAAGSTTGSALVKQGIIDAAGAMDTSGVPKGDRYVVVTPTVFYGLMNEDDVVSSDFGAGANRAVAGSLSYMGFEILNSAIWTDFANAAGTAGIAGEVLFGLDGRATYDVVLTNVFGCAFHKEAAGIVSLKGMTTETDWIPERQGNLIVAKQAIGIDILRPTSSILLKTASA